MLFKWSEWGRMKWRVITNDIESDTQYAGNNDVDAMLMKWIMWYKINENNNS